MDVNIHRDLEKVIKEENISQDAFKELVGQIFDDCSSLILQPFNKRGFSGAVLSIAQGIRTTGLKTFVCILKVSQKCDIKREFEHYTKYVKGCLDHSWVPAIYGDEPKYQDDLGAIAYSKVGGGKENPIQFGELYVDAEIPHINCVLETLFNGLMYPWIELRQFSKNPLSASKIPINLCIFVT